MLAHRRGRRAAALLTETCASDSVNVITDVATTSAATNDGQAVPGPASVHQLQ